MKLIAIAGAAAAALGLLVSPAEAATDKVTRAEAAADAADAPARKFPSDLAVGLGMRIGWTPDSGLAPYLERGVIPQFAVTGSLPIFRRGRFSLAAVTEWDVGGAGAEARGSPTSMITHRIAGGLEGRFSLATRLYGFTRVAPSAIYIGASIEDGAVSDRPLRANGWTWGLDTSGGAALMIAGNARSKLHLWLIAEAGYSFSGSVAMDFAPDLVVDEPRTFGTVSLPDASVQGAIGSLSLALAF